MRADIRYGKHEIPFYRTHPTRGIFAGRVTVDVFGENFLPAYTEGDNSNVVATDTMKNFVHAKVLEFSGDRYDAFAAFLAHQFRDHYPQMHALRIFVRELVFVGHSPKLFSPLDDDYETVQLEVDGKGLRLRCGRRNLRLIKTTGSAFKSFARDQFTTLPEVKDRPLYIFLDLYWRYAEPLHALASGKLYGSATVRDCVVEAFDDFVSMSIQHLVYEMGKRVLARFPDLAEVSFDAQNRIWETVQVSEADPTIRVYADPRPAHGVIGLTLKREDQ